MTPRISGGMGKASLIGLLLTSLGPQQGIGFSIVNPSSMQRGWKGYVTDNSSSSSSGSSCIMTVARHHDMETHPEEEDMSPQSNRRDMLARTAAIVASMTLVPTYSALAEDESTTATTATAPMGTDPSHPIIVLGAGGRCGLLCTKVLASKGLYVKAVTRSGRSVLDDDDKFVSYGAGDVTKLESLSATLKDASGVIFAASASKKGGDAAHVDYLGVANTAKACVSNKVPKLAIISSLAVTRPASIGFKITNIFGRIMDYKIAGEYALRDVYSTVSPDTSSYVIVRPGGLADGPAEGASALTLSQGDILSGEVSREDVANVVVSSLLNTKDRDVTLELNNSKGMSKSIPKDLTLSKDDETKLTHTADSYDRLVEGLYSDREMGELFASVVSDYKGTKVEPLDKL